MGYFIKTVLLLLVFVSFAGCGHPKTEEEILRDMLEARAGKASAHGTNPSDIVDVKLFFLDGEQIVSDFCVGFVMDNSDGGKLKHNNVGVVLGTADRRLLSTPFVVSFPTRQQTGFTCMASPSRVRLIGRTKVQDTEFYILATVATETEMPDVVAGGRYATNLESYLFTLFSVFL